MNNLSKILVIDSDPDVASSLIKVFNNNFYQIEFAENIDEGLLKAKKLLPNLIMLDINMCNINYVETIKKLNEASPDAIIILLIKDSKDITFAIEAMSLGVYDYIQKPLPYDRLQIIINKALEKKDLRNEVELLKSRLEKRFSFDRITGNSKAIREVFSMVKKIAKHNISVLILGESGTGKELLARVIHYESNRSNRSFVPIDCSTLPETLVESEIFGYEKGAFSGAYKMNIGKIELAQGGSIFFDEIGNLPLNIQIKLLRMLQEKEIERIGGRKQIKIDARIIAATNVDLNKNITNGLFREDLFYRLNEFTIYIPALRERKEDIPLLMKNFLCEFNIEFNKDIRGFSTESQEIFMNYNWPGNIRELKNVIKRAVLLAEEIIDIRHLPLEIISKSYNLPKVKSDSDSLKKVSQLHVESVERDLILAKLNEVHWNKRKAAELLSVDYKTLFNKMKKYNIT
ncbi:MAG: sigma-54-dependent Fis family transcriptional regulator [Candidatus Firestonebacteria bacterium]|nr:sigma-54-dependent Fis family transcriptional regulator [Candidatus Firestonebacteria bacterium]